MSDDDNTKISYPEHRWGEEGFDWAGLDHAGMIIYKTCTRYARLGIHFKEKYGTLRVSAWWWGGEIHSALYPGYVYCQYGKGKIGRALWYLDIWFWPKITGAIGLRRLVHWWQQKVYGYAYEKALKKYPHLREEILVDCDYPHLVKGGQEVHDKYWITVK